MTNRASCFLLALTLALSPCFPFTANAKVTRITIEKERTTHAGKLVEGVSSYEIMSGHAYGEIDPKDPHNRIITDIEKAPTNARGMVEYVATFTLEIPSIPSKGNGVMLYFVPNRGNRISASAYRVHGESRDEFLMKHGYIILQSGWQGDLPPRAGAETIQVPIALNPDGTSITGPALARFSNMKRGIATLSLPAAHTTASLDTTKATLTKRRSDTDPAIPVVSSDWAFSNSSHKPFPGEPDPNKISVRGGFDPAYLYQLSYTAKDPLVLGIGLAATRDIVSFFHHADADESGTANPVARRVKYVIAQGVSQAGDFIKTFLCLGFNADEADRIVWDGANPHIAGRQLALNIRFGYPSGIAHLYEAGSEGTLWWSEYTDVARGRAPSSLLDRCNASNTCPKIFETFGSTEFWGLHMSPWLVGTKADTDIPPPSNVRLYFFPGTTHGGGSGGFNLAPAAASYWQLLPNPNSETETMRALLVALTAWVTKDVPPPASVYPRLDEGQLVPPNFQAMGFPSIPKVPLISDLINPFYNYDFGPEFNYPNVSGVMTILPPIIKGTLPELVPKVNGDGNETSGIASVLLQVPLGTYVGWNIPAKGYYKGHGGDLEGGFIPFSKTKAERVKSNDPRLSLEERYHDHDTYVAQVRCVAAHLSEQGFLLQDDASRLVREARDSKVLK